MAVKVGISPIAWQNDDLPDLTADYTMDQALAESRDIGFAGVERGQRMPKDTEGLRAYLDRYDLALCGGWCSGSLLTNTVAEEVEAVRAQVQQFVDLGAPCLVYAECSNTIQGAREVPVSARPKLSTKQITDYAAKLTDLASWMADQGMPLVYHHHMGSMIEAQEDVDALMAGSGEAVGLCFDTGHLIFGGGDIDATMDRWGARIRHVHFKDIRGAITELARLDGLSFLDAVIEGAFTVPGDGDIDFGHVAQRLKALDYDGWIVIEAEQDPAKANPLEYSRRGYQHILEVCAAAGLEVAAR